jgi:DNA-binding transcriptional MerR regulator
VGTAPFNSALSITATGEVRRALGLTQRQFEYLLACHPELEPPRLAGRRCFTPDDVERLRLLLADRAKGRQP